MTRMTVAFLGMFVAISSSTNAGLIIQQSGGNLAPNDSVVYDLIFKHEPIPLPGSTLQLDSFLNVRFQTPQANSPGSPNPTIASLAPVGSFQLFPPFDPSTEGPSFILPIPFVVSLDPMDQVTFATLTVDIPDGFFGSFDLVLDRTIIAAGPSPNELGIDWATQENPALGVQDLPPPSPPGNPPVPFTFTSVAIPEPSPLMLLGLLGSVGCLLSKRRQ